MRIYCWKCPECGATWGSDDERRQSDREWCHRGCSEFPVRDYRAEAVGVNVANLKEARR